VYRKTVQPLVHTLFQNGKATCFAYGQTGSGKTYTMSPLPIRAAADILQYLARPEYSDVSLFVSCFEIYGNKVFDLLNSRKKLNILEDAKKKVVVVGLKVRGRGRHTLPCRVGSRHGAESSAATPSSAPPACAHHVLSISSCRPCLGLQMHPHAPTCKA
jgi:kinesin family protein 2/24